MRMNIVLRISLLDKSSVGYNNVVRNVGEGYV